MFLDLALKKHEVIALTSLIREEFKFHMERQEWFKPANDYTDIFDKAYGKNGNWYVYKCSK